MDWYIEETLRMMVVQDAQRQVIEAQLRADQYEWRRAVRQIATLTRALEIYTESRRYVA